ncbi:MAG: NADP-dependent oxidoreductase [Chloroflexia bacterium]
MKAVRIYDFGASDVLKYEEVDLPEPSDDELLVRVRAASASPIDWKMREGYVLKQMGAPMPTVLGRDYAGDVVTVGANVIGFAAGDPVFGRVLRLHTGCYSDYITVTPEEVVAMPASLDYEEAAAVPHSALTAWQALVETADVSPGQTVLIHGAAGGVGSFAVQMVKALGARAIGTCSPNNLEFLRELGADEVIDYNATRFEDVVSDVDMVLDTRGGETQERSWQVIKPGGILVTLVSWSPTSLEEAAARGVRAEMISRRPDRENLHSIAALIEEGRIKPVVSDVLPLHKIGEAHDRLADDHVRGKIVMRMEPDQ